MTEIYSSTLVYYHQVIDPAWQEEDDGQGSSAAGFKGLEGVLEASPQAHVGKRGNHWKLYIKFTIKGGEGFLVFMH